MDGSSNQPQCDRRTAGHSSAPHDPKLPDTASMPAENSRSSETVSTPVGPITLTCTAEAVVRVEWTQASPETAAGEEHRAPASASEELLAGALEQLGAYFDGERTDFDLPIHFGEVSEVARVVLTTLATGVGYGTTVTYGELAERSGTGIPARAVGGIMGLNPIPIIVPCHRIVAGEGLGGYSGGLPGKGLETKRELLEREGALPPPLF